MLFYISFLFIKLPVGTMYTMTITLFKLQFCVTNLLAIFLNPIVVYPYFTKSVVYLTPQGITMVIIINITYMTDSTMGITTVVTKKHPWFLHVSIPITVSTAIYMAIIHNATIFVTYPAHTVLYPTITNLIGLFFIDHIFIATP